MHLSTNNLVLEGARNELQNELDTLKALKVVSEAVMLQTDATEFGLDTDRTQELEATLKEERSDHKNELDSLTVDFYKEKLTLKDKNESLGAKINKLKNKLDSLEPAILVSEAVVLRTDATEFREVDDKIQSLEVTLEAVVGRGEGAPRFCSDPTPSGLFGSDPHPLRFSKILAVFGPFSLNLPKGGLKWGFVALLLTNAREY